MWKSKDMGSPLEPPRGLSPAYPLILAQQDPFRTSDLQSAGVCWAEGPILGAPSPQEKFTAGGMELFKLLPPPGSLGFQPPVGEFHRGSCSQSTSTQMLKAGWTHVWEE